MRVADEEDEREEDADEDEAQGRTVVARSGTLPATMPAAPEGFISVPGK